VSKHIIEIDETELNELQAKYDALVNAVLDGFLASVSDSWPSKGDGDLAIEDVDKEAHELASKLGGLLKKAKPVESDTLAPVLSLVPSEK